MRATISTSQFVCVAYHPAQPRRARLNFSFLLDTQRHDLANGIGELDSIGKTQQFRKGCITQFG